MKRFMRDHVRIDVGFITPSFIPLSDRTLFLYVSSKIRYLDWIQCAAARVVGAMKDKARAHDANNTQGRFGTMHIRRGDFQTQFAVTMIAAAEILKMISKRFKEGSTIFIATDERNQSFFDPIKARYNVFFLHDFKQELGVDVNTNYFGMIDQLVASRGDEFFGCWFSTFTVSQSRNAL
jgi:hypothetical protein